MSTFVLRMLSIRRELAIELQRFILLWRYQHRVPPFALWWRLVLKRIVDVAGALAGLRRRAGPVGGGHLVPAALDAGRDRRGAGLHLAHLGGGALRLQPAVRA